MASATNRSTKLIRATLLVGLGLAPSCATTVSGGGPGGETHFLCAKTSDCAAHDPTLVCVGSECRHVDGGVAVDAARPSHDAARPPLDAPYVREGASIVDCPVDAGSRFTGSCTGGCPTGTICAVEIGGLHGGGGEYCAPIPASCRATPNCACLGSCACGPGIAMAEQTCTDLSGRSGISCDDGIR